MSWRNTREYRIWRAIIIRRDKVCQVCGTREARNAHHIESGAYNEELRYESENGICLCRGCHTQYHTNFNRSFRVKTTRYNLENFFSLIEYFKTVKVYNGIDK